MRNNLVICCFQLSCIEDIYLSAKNILPALTHVVWKFEQQVDNYFDDYKASICYKQIPNQCFFLNPACPLRRNSFSWNLATGSWTNLSQMLNLQPFLPVFVENVTKIWVMVKFLLEPFKGVVWKRGDKDLVDGVDHNGLAGPLLLRQPWLQGVSHWPLHLGFIWVRFKLRWFYLGQIRVVLSGSH